MLNVLNRIITIIALLLIIAVALIVGLGFVIPGIREGMLTTLSSWLTLPEGMQTTERIVGLMVSLAVALLAFFMLIFELRPAPKTSTVRVRNADGQVTAIEREAISSRVQHTVDMLDDVVRVVPTIKGGGSGLEVHLDVVTTPMVDIPMKTTEIREAARAVIEDQMGLAIKKLTLKVDHSDLNELSGKGVR
ncbi:MAG: alkaline shock response membrane anchor protein AmaP [Anaerolineales bacterium]|nr:alkaline shock response membrane anchor protein AmaP [Anaerolineales bacterium]MCB9127148.1 alkaline shock response membrane anchor protein AmaP [Ardenticatenales bacterium]MCB9171908.1 alkaline shock response membrane anchor protein AmaP [Ardenticatenales bacterium]